MFNKWHMSLIGFNAHTALEIMLRKKIFIDTRAIATGGDLAT